MPKSAVRRKPASRPAADTAGRRRGAGIEIWLALIYVAAAILHFVLLRPQSSFTLVPTDEVQYLSVAENIRLGNGFVTRGEFHAGIPPLYPLLVALAHSFGSYPRLSALWFNCLAMCLAVFPAYGLARHIHLERPVALLLAAAAALLPNTLWAGLYMAEPLNYPLFLSAFLVLAKWVEKPAIALDWMAGLLLSAMLLTKVAAWSLAAAVLITAILRFRSDRAALGRHLVRIFGLVALTQIGWQAFKYFHRAAGLGVYGRVLADSGLPNLSWSLLAQYLGDFLLSPGLLVTIPLVLWFRKEGRARPALATLLATTLLCELSIHSILEAGLTGSLKERLLFYSFPIMAIFAVKGVESLARSQTIEKILFIAVPLLLLLVVSSYAFPYNPVLDIPWASMLGSFAWRGVDSFTKQHFAILAVLLISGMGAVLLADSARLVARTLAIFILAFHAVTFASGAVEMAQLSNRGKPLVDGVAYWLSLNHVNANDRLILCGRMGYYQESERSTPLDPLFVNWHESFGLTNVWNFQLETYGRYDVRMAQSPDQIAGFLRPGDHLLAATRLTGLDLISYRFPLYLYAAHQSLAAAPRPLYTFDITKDQSYGRVLDPPINLLPGGYRARLYLRPTQTFSVEAVNLKDNTILFHSQGSAAELRAFEFSAPQNAVVQFRMASEPERAQFQELTLEYLR